MAAQLKAVKFIMPDGRMGGGGATCYLVSVALHQTDFFFLTLSSKFLLNPAAVLSCIHCFFFFFALPVGATEERPEPSLKMFFFCFKNVPFVTLATEPESSTGRITLSIAALR